MALKTDYRASAEGQRPPLKLTAKSTDRHGAALGVYPLLVAGLSMLGCFNASVDAEDVESLQEALGFTHTTPYVRAGTERVEVLAVQSIDPEGIFARSGVHAGDIILWQGHDVRQFYETLKRHRGKQIEITVVPGGDGPSLRIRPTRTVLLAVPANGAPR